MKNKIVSFKFETIIHKMMSLICLGLLFCNVSCFAKYSKKLDFAPLDSALRYCLGDSAASIIIQAQNVSIERIKVESDSSFTSVAKKLTRSERDILSFLMISRDSCSEAPVVYGAFRPNVRFIYHTNKAELCMEIDFGLNQLHINDAKGRCLYNMECNDKRLLKFCNVLLKNDEYLLLMLKKI